MNRPYVPPRHEPWLSELGPALLAEVRVLNEVREILAAQRAAVAASDREGIEGSVESLGRALHGLETTRRHRRSLLEAAGLGGIDSLDALEQAGITFPDAVRAARTQLRETAKQVARDLSINQRILRGALEAGDAFLQQLFASAADPLPSYGTGDRTEQRPESMMLNRTV